MFIGNIPSWNHAAGIQATSVSSVQHPLEISFGLATCPQINITEQVDDHYSTPFLGWCENLQKKEGSASQALMIFFRPSEREKKYS